MKQNRNLKQTSGEKKILGPAEAAGLLNVKVSIIRRWMNTGLVKSRKRQNGKPGVSKKEILSFASKLGKN